MKLLMEESEFHKKVNGEVKYEVGRVMVFVRDAIDEILEEDRGILDPFRILKLLRQSAQVADDYETVKKIDLAIMKQKGES